MVSNEQRRVRRRKAAARPLAGVEVSGEHDETQRPPASGLVPSTPWGEELPLSVRAALDGRERPDRRLQPGEAAPDRFQLAQSDGCHVDRDGAPAGIWCRTLVEANVSARADGADAVPDRVHGALPLLVLDLHAEQHE